MSEKKFQDLTKFTLVHWKMWVYFSLQQHLFLFLPKHDKISVLESQVEERCIEGKERGCTDPHKSWDHAFAKALFPKCMVDHRPAPLVETAGTQPEQDIRTAQRLRLVPVSRRSRPGLLRAWVTRRSLTATRGCVSSSGLRTGLEAARQPCTGSH